MKPESLRFIGRLAQGIREKGNLVECGALYGSSSWTWSKNAPASIKIYSIDPWEPAGWITGRFKDHPDCLPFGIDAFKYYTRDCRNITAIQGCSPECVRDWEEPIDAYFDDALHHNPGLVENLEFWRTKLRPGGLLCGDDYVPGWPDVVNEVDRICAEWNTHPTVVGWVWAVRKPLDGETVAPSLEETLPRSNTPGLKVKARCADGFRCEVIPEAWAGRPFRNIPVTAYSVDWDKSIDGLEIQYACRGASGAQSEWLGATEECTLPNGEPLESVALRLHGRRAPEFKVSYELCPTFGEIFRGCHVPIFKGDTGVMPDLREHGALAAFRVFLDYA